MTDKQTLEFVKKGALILIEEIEQQADIFYSIIKKQYPSKEWLDLTEAERNMLEYFNRFLLKYVATRSEDNEL